MTDHMLFATVPFSLQHKKWLTLVADVVDLVVDAVDVVVAEDLAVVAVGTRRRNGE